MSYDGRYNEFLVKAYYAAQYSPDPSTQNGSVLLGENGVIGVGFNDFPPGIDPNYWHGEKADKYARVVHAEVSAILSAARRGNRTVHSTLIAPWAACSNCAKHIVEAGVVRLVRHAFLDNGVTTGNYWYEDCLIGDEIMKAGGVEIVEVDPVVPPGVQLRRDGKLWPV